MRRYTTSRPKTLATMELYILAKDLLHLKNKAEAEKWGYRFVDWMERYQVLFELDDRRRERSASADS